MTSTEIIQRALADGVFIAVDGTESLKLIGDQAMVSKWLPEIRKNKDALLAVLSSRQDKIESAPAVCRNCPRLEAVEIQGERVLGCLYQATGEFSEGWRRLPADLRKCIFH